MDFNKDVHIIKWKDGEKGVDVVTPFYTHLDNEEKTCGILVNRGWLPWDLKLARLDKRYGMTSVQGVLYTGDKKTHNSGTNTPLNNAFFHVYPEELAVVT